MKIIALTASLISLISAQTFVEILAENNFTYLLDAIAKANLTDTVNNLQNVTVFVPTNEAFEQIKDVPLTAEDLQAVLLTHAAFGVLRSTDLTNTTVPSLNNEELTIVVSDGKVSVNGISVVKADIISSQGVAHVIEKVIIPSSLKLGGSTTGTSTTGTSATGTETASSEYVENSSVMSGPLSILSMFGLLFL